MRRQDLYRKIKDLKAVDFFRSLELQIKTTKPDGSINHGLAGLKETLSIKIELYKRGVYPIEETIAEYRQREEYYNTTMGRIVEAVNKGGIKI